ncbi:MAG: hypothetical protein D6B27_03970 [Gammaproteobacteria bacterium]|nr:MAG: hypothetical protein D6B27_03970 [Gammaproteobacteria bacterium]
MRKFTLIISIILFSITTNAYKNDNYSINGFLSIGGIYNSAESNFDETLKADKLDLSFANILGIQAKYRISEKLGLTGQLVSRGGDNDDYDIDLNWGFISYEYSPNISFKIGRIIAPLFLTSDYIDVGHAYPTPTPVKELYWQVPFSSNSGDGIDITYKINFGDWFFSTQATYGLTNGKVREQEYKTKALAVNSEISNEYIKIRASYAPAYMDMDFSPLLIPVINTYLSQYNITGLNQSLHNHIKMDNTKVSFSSIGISYEDEKYLLMTEYGATRIDKSYPESEALYLTLGYRFNEIMIYNTLSKIRTCNLDKLFYKGENALEIASEPIVNEVLTASFNIKESGFAIGTVYYLSPNMDLTFEYKMIDTHGTVGLYDDITHNNEKMISLVFNAVF